MPETLWIYLDCDWVGAPVLVGRLFRETLRGAPKYAFEFDESWLVKYSGIRLSADLENYVGRQFLTTGAEIFGCFSDAMPDRWGRVLLERREQILAQREKRPPKTLTAFDMLCGLMTACAWGGCVSSAILRAASLMKERSSPFLRLQALVNLPKPPRRLRNVN